MTPKEKRYITRVNKFHIGTRGTYQGRLCTVIDMKCNCVTIPHEHHIKECGNHSLSIAFDDEKGQTWPKGVPKEWWISGGIWAIKLGKEQTTT